MSQTLPAVLQLAHQRHCRPLPQEQGSRNHEMAISKEEQLILNNSNEESRIIQPVEYKVEVNFDWDKPKEEWELVQTAIIIDKLELKSSRGLRQAIERFGGEFKHSNGKRTYLVPPFKSVYSLGK